MGLFTRRRDLGHARQVANQHRVRVQELEQALEAVLNPAQSVAEYSAAVAHARRVLRDRPTIQGNR